jgi:hypothetical protein
MKSSSRTPVQTGDAMAGTNTRPQTWTSWVIIVITLVLIVGMFLLASQYLMS